MAFSYTKNSGEGHAGGLRITQGKAATTATSTSGTVYTGLSQVQSFVIGLSTTGAIAYTVATLPQGYDGIPVVLTTGATAYWIAAGY